MLHPSSGPPQASYASLACHALVGASARGGLEDKLKSSVQLHKHGIIGRWFVATLILAASALLLQGCSHAKTSCTIADIYPLIMVDGKTNLTKSQLEEAGITLCARHTARQETYQGEGACSKPEKVFLDGELPDIMTGDSQALLLVRCPTASYSNGKDMQRVLCTKDYASDDDASSNSNISMWEDERELSIRFDDTRVSANCETSAKMAKEQAEEAREDMMTSTDAPAMLPGPSDGGDAGPGGGVDQVVQNSGPEQFPKSMFFDMMGMSGPLPDPAEQAAARARRRRSHEKEDRKAFQVGLHALVRSEGVARHPPVADMITAATIIGNSMPIS